MLAGVKQGVFVKREPLGKVALLELEDLASRARVGFHKEDAAGVQPVEDPGGRLVVSQIDEKVRATVIFLPAAFGEEVPWHVLADGDALPEVVADTAVTELELRDAVAKKCGFERLQEPASNSLPLLTRVYEDDEQTCRAKCRVPGRTESDWNSVMLGHQA